MSTTNPALHVSRTYGKRSVLKRKQTKEPTEQNGAIPALAEPNIVKRRRLSPGLEPEPEPETHAPTETDVGTDNEMDSPEKPPAKVGLGSPRKVTAGSTQLGQQSPSRPARDLSVIFDEITPIKYPPASPSKLSKRMLARSKTDSSVESQSKSPNQLFERTPSLPTLPSPSKKPEPSVPTTKTAGSIVPLIPPSSNSLVTRTYAGRRSFLVALPASSNDPLLAGEEDEFDTRESYTALRNRWGVDVSEDDPYGTPSPSKSTKSHRSTPEASPSRKGKKLKTDRSSLISTGELTLKSISELRHKGESRRFLDEVGYLFEGMDKKGGLNLRRASALEITSKLCDPEFTRKGKAADFFVRTWDVFIQAGAGKGEDKILDIIFVFFVALVARDPVSLTEMAQRTSVPNDILEGIQPNQSSQHASLVDVLFSILDNTPSNADPLALVKPGIPSSEIEFKKAGINKKDRATLESVYRTIASKSNLFSSNTSLSISLLVSYALQNLSPSFISVEYFPSLLSSLRLSLSPGTSTSLKSTLSLNWSTATDSVAYENIYYHLRLLDTYLLDQWASPSTPEGTQSQGDEQPRLKEQKEEAMEKARDIWLVDDLISLGVCIEINAPNDDLESVQGCLDTTLRILVSLTHANESWARRVVQCEYTMGWLMRLIYKNGRDVQRNWSKIEAENPVKSEETEELLSDDQEETNPNATALDTLCLALGLLTNLVQIVQEAKHVVNDTRLSSTCTLKKKTCAQHCNCPHSLSGIEILGQLYTLQQVKEESPPPDALMKDSPEARAEAEASFLRGHLAVLFGLLMMNDSENESAIMAALPSTTSKTPTNVKNMKIAKRQKMTRLVEQARVFAAFYAAVNNRLGGEQDSKVVKEVVAFLEMKRDSLL